MDHYDELVVAHAQQGGGKRWLDSLEMEIARDRRVQLSGAPTGSKWGYEIAGWERDEQLGVLLVWRTKGDCDECLGSCEVEYRARSGGYYDVECPVCEGGGLAETEDGAVLSDLDGHYVRDAV